jgi:hypothetical protein
LRLAPAGDGAAGAALAQNADFASNLAAPDLAPPPVRSWYLRSVGRDLLKGAGVHKRLRWCGQKISSISDGVGVYRRPSKSYGRFSGVCVCGQSLCCPVCAPRIAAFRAEDLAGGFERAKALGWEARLVTYKMPHQAGEGLGALVDTLATAWRRMTSAGSYSRKCRKGSHGNVTAFEFTYGEHGWHPHKHQLRFDKAGTFQEHTHRAAWHASLESVGRASRGSWENCFDVGEVGDVAGAVYCSKLALAVDAQARAVSNEVALGTAKQKGRNIMRLLADAAAGDEDAARIWLSGVRDIIARKVTSLRWSRGLRDLLGVPAEREDGDIAADSEEPCDEFLGQLNPLQWRIVVGYRAELALAIAANRGVDAVNSFLLGLGAGFLNEPTEACELSAGLDSQIAKRVLGQKITRADIVGAELQREFDRPSGLTRSQLEAMKD